MDDRYYSIIKEATTTIKIRGSKFIGHVTPVNTRKEAEDYIDFISEKNYDATHNCTAFKVGIGDKALFKYNDDGEPGGTGGRPILKAIEGKGLTNVAGVVTRYFGGIKFGTGGLSRAYKNCTDRALGKAGKREFFFTNTFFIDFPYHFTGVVMELIEKYTCTIKHKKYGDKVELTVAVKKSLSDEFKQTLLDKTGGKIIIKEIENEST